MFHINAGEVIKENITGRGSKIKEKKSGNNPERRMYINVYIIFFFEEMIKITTANNDNTNRPNTVTHKTILAKTTANALIQVKTGKQ